MSLSSRRPVAIEAPASYETQPHSLEVERALLGAVLVDDSTIESALREGITREHFYLPEHGALWAKCVELHQMGVPLDLTTVASGAPAEVEGLGGRAVLGALTDGVPRSSNAGAYARDIIERYEERERIKHARLIERRPDRATAARAAELINASVQRSERVTGASPLVTDRDLVLAALENPPPDLVADLIPCKSFVVVWGPYGSYKSTAVLDLAYSVQIGRAWLGRHAVTQGDVVYVAGEGGAGLYKRALAWMAEHELDLDAAHLNIWREPVNLLEPAAVQRFLARLGDLKPVLVIFDTLATCSTGADENSSTDMGRIVASSNAIRSALDCSVLLVHHSTKSGDTERGHSSLGGAADVMIRCTGTNLALTMEWAKNKDLAECSDISVALNVVTVLNGKTALVISNDRREDKPAHTRAAVPALQALVDAAGGAGTTGPEWLAVAQAKHGYRGTSTFYRHRTDLLEADYVRPLGKVFVPTERGRAILTESHVDSHEA